MRLGHRYPQRVRGPVDPEALRLDDPGATNRKQHLGPGKRRLHQHLGDLARPVVALVRNELHVLLGHGALWRALPAGHPQRQLALVGPPRSVTGHRPDPIAATELGRELALARLGSRRQAAGLRVDGLLHPLALLPAPIHPRSRQGDRPAAHGLAVQVDHQRLDLQGLPTLDEEARAAQPDVDVRRMHHEAGRAGPALSVHVGDEGLRPDVHRPRRVDRVEADPRLVAAPTIGLAVQDLSGRRRRRARMPPREPAAKRPLATVGWAEPGARCRDPPLGVGPRQRPPGVVGRVHRQGRAPPDQVRASRSRSADLELRPPELLDAEAVVVAALQRRIHKGQRDGGVPEVRRLGQVQLQVEAAERVDRRRTLGQHVPPRPLSLPLYPRAGAPERREVTALAPLEPPDPALEVRCLAGTIQLTIVEDVPEHRVARRALHPARAVAPRLRPLRQERHVSVLPGDQHPGLVARRLGQRQPTQAVGAGLPARPGRQGQLHPAQRLAGLQVRHPADQLASVHEGPKADVSPLHPHRALPLAGLRRPHRRAHDDDRVADALAKDAAQVDRHFVYRVRRSGRLDHRVDDQLSGRVDPTVLPIAVPQVDAVGRPVLGSHPVRFDLQLAHVDDVGRQLRRAAGVEDDEWAARHPEGGLGRAHADAGRGRLAQGLPEPVPQRSIEGDRVFRVALGQPVDLDLPPHREHLKALESRLDGHPLGIEGVLVQGVVEAHRPGPAGSAVAPPAAGLLQRQRGVGMEGVVLSARRLAWPLGGRKAGSESDLHRRVLRERRGRNERHPASLLGVLQQPLNLGVGLALRRRRLTHRDRLAGGGHDGRPEHGRGVDRLVEGGHDHGLQIDVVSLRKEPLDPGRWGLEAPAHRLREHAARRRGRAGGHRHGVRGGHREARVRVEDQRLGTDPAPLPGWLRRELHGNRLRSLVVRCDGDHRLRERHAEVRRQRDVALRLAAQHLERPGHLSRGGRGARRGRERSDDRLAFARRRLGALT